MKSLTLPRPSTRWPVAAALLGMLLGMVLFAPARLLSWGMEHATQGHVLLPNSQGLLWQGQSDLVLSGGPGSRAQQALPDGIRWSLNPAWRSAPAIAWQLEAPCCTAQPINGTIALDWHGLHVQLQPLKSQWPASLLQGLGSPWNTLQLQGQLSIGSPGLETRWKDATPQTQGSLTVEALELSSSLSTLKPLGSYRLVLNAQTDQATDLNLSTLAGPLRLSGHGSWGNRGLHFQGLAESEPSSLGALSNLLNLLGRRDGPRAHISLG